MTRAVSFDSDGLRLVGVLGGPTPARAGVVLVHGWSGYRIGPHRILVNTARRLNAEGYATLHFDLRGRGDSEGEYDRTSLDMMIADTLNAAAFLRREAGRPEVSLLGLCSGANVAIGAATLDHSIRRVVAWSALPFQKQVTGEQHKARRKSNLMKYLRKALSPATWRKVLTGRVNYDLVGQALQGSDAVKQGEANLKDSERDILAELADYPGSLLFVHGSKDPEGMVGREHFQAFCSEHFVTDAGTRGRGDAGTDQAGGRRLEAGGTATARDAETRRRGDAETTAMPSPGRARFHLIEGANHSYYSLAWEKEIVELAVEFLRE